MAHDLDKDPIEELKNDATLTDCILKINEIARIINHMWFPVIEQDNGNQR
tara:strand:+ start:802 stop:951 length:150 start_codon:yes stop_codon:yes gene_type:complete